MSEGKKTDIVFSREPDEQMRWIYDPTHKDYNSCRARHLREQREAALRSCPKWMINLRKSGPER